MVIIIINVLTKVTLNEIRCNGTLQSRWSMLTDSTSRKADTVRVEYVKSVTQHQYVLNSNMPLQ